MILKKLKPRERLLTRPLWRQVFEEDTEDFLDYYYTEKIKDNEIYVIETEGEIRSMLHLNPYILRIGRKETESCYIVAVATDVLHRGQGYMTELLKKSMRDMYASQVPFTFLMPASEKIYYPHHFRFIYSADQWKVFFRDEEAGRQKMSAALLLETADRKACMAGGRMHLKRAVHEDAKKLSEFAECLLRDSSQVYAKRSRQYYERLLKELSSENGGIIFVEEEDAIRGMFQYSEENGFSVKEPMTSPGYEQIFDELGIGLAKENKKPMIMARILHLETLLSCMVCWEDMDLKFWLVDPLIQENNKLFMIKGNCEHLVVRTTPAPKQDEMQKISISALTSILFGYKSLEAIEKEEQETFSEEFKAQARKLVPLRNIFLNEIV